MTEQQQQHQHIGFQYQLPTENFVVVVARCHICGEFLDAKAFAKAPPPPLPKQESVDAQLSDSSTDVPK